MLDSKLRLAVVPPDEYQQFADALREFRPHSYQVEAMLRGHLKYQHFDLLKASLYAPSDAALRHNLAVIAPAGSGNKIFTFKIYWNERRLSDNDVYELLRSLPAARWNQPVLIRQMPSHLRAKMDVILSQLSEGELHLLTTMRMGLFTLAPDDIPPVPVLPKGYYFATLDGSYGEEVLMRWVGAYIDAVEPMCNLLDKLPSAAVFRKTSPKSIDDEGDSNQNDELVSYSLYKFVSDLGMTYTKENHRRRGLARAATLQLAHRVREDGLPVTVAIDDSLKGSINMHLKMGFKPYSRIEIGYYFPKGFDFKRNVSHLINFEKCFSESIKKWEELWGVE